jgi:hypothetical protein
MRVRLTISSTKVVAIKLHSFLECSGQRAHKAVTGMDAGGALYRAILKMIGVIQLHDKA